MDRHQLLPARAQGTVWQFRCRYPEGSGVLEPGSRDKQELLRHRRPEVRDVQDRSVQRPEPSQFRDPGWIRRHVEPDYLRANTEYVFSTQNRGAGAEIHVLTTTSENLLLVQNVKCGTSNPGPFSHLAFGV